MTKVDYAITYKNKIIGKKRYPTLKEARAAVNELGAGYGYKVVYTENYNFEKK